jgi:hypothetical protein
MKSSLPVKLQLPWSLILAGLVMCLTYACKDPENQDRLILQEETGFLQIPGVGWQTFYSTADTDGSVAGLRFKSGCAYYRWYWVSLEPQEGEYAFGMIDSLLARCRRNNQALAIRVMCEDPWGEGLPQWLINKGIRRTYTPCPEEGAHYAPDMSDPVFKDYHQRLIRALGNRYDGHPDLALVDIGSVGLWGEGHIYCDPDLMPSRAIRNENTDLYYETFPNTPLTGLVDDKPNVLYANSKGRSAWRGDCWGNGNAPGVNWNHHKDSYWPMVDLMPDGWRVGTVALEPCGTLGSFPTPPKEVVDDAISWHVTFIQNKSHQLPAEWVQDIERLMMKIGFRLVLRDLDYNDAVPSGSTLALNMKWENTGIAPPYRDHRIAFRLRDETKRVQAVVMSDQSIRGWLPGETVVAVNYPIPAGLTPGKYTLEMGIVFHSSMDHVIPIANKGKTSDGWYMAGGIKVKSGK